MHIQGDKQAPHLNKTVFGRTRGEFLASTGSRYAPASPCDRLDAIESAGGKAVFLGKPCDVEALRKAQAIRPQLDHNVGVVIGIFCAGTPSTKGTLDLLRRHGVAPRRRGGTAIPWLRLAWQLRGQAQGGRALAPIWPPMRKPGASCRPTAPIAAICADGTSELQISHVAIPGIVRSNRTSLAYLWSWYVPRRGATSYDAPSRRARSNSHEWIARRLLCPNASYNSSAARYGAV